MTHPKLDALETILEPMTSGERSTARCVMIGYLSATVTDEEWAAALAAGAAAVERDRARADLEPLWAAALPGDAPGAWIRSALDALADSRGAQGVRNTP
jgi:hypothetical protein